MKSSHIYSNQSSVFLCDQKPESQKTIYDLWGLPVSFKLIKLIRVRVLSYNMRRTQKMKFKELVIHFLTIWGVILPLYLAHTLSSMLLGTKTKTKKIPAYILMENPEKKKKANKYISLLRDYKIACRYMLSILKFPYGLITPFTNKCNSSYIVDI